MENNSNGSIEKDAVPTTSQTSTVERRISTGSELVDRDDNIIQTVGNNTMLANQTNTSAILTFKECTGITLGTFINVGWTPGMGAGGNVADWPAKDAVVKAEEKIGKTPTIKKMMDSTETISSAFLDVVSGNFGSRWRDVTILLNISHLFVDRMYEDHFERGGTKEVMFQILSSYLKDNDDQKTVGWLITFLWRNGFKKTVWTVKEHYKKLRELDGNFDD